MSASKSACATGVAVIAALTVVSCSSSKSGSDQTATGPAGSPPSSSAPPSSNGATSNSRESSPASGSLSGDWTGSYGGSYQGTFHLHWTQNASRLSGSIDLSSVGMLPLHGTVSDGQINFGTVGSTVITYTGTVSGDSMSGHYQIAGGSGGTGSWTAHRA
jgi:hypothetical protein